MKKQILIIIITMITSLGLVSFTNNYLKANMKKVSKIETKPIEIVNLELKPIEIEINQTEMFLNAIGHRESSNRYDVVNKWGYMGKYQFGRKTLKNLGYKCLIYN